MTVSMAILCAIARLYFYTRKSNNNLCRFVPLTMKIIRMKS